MQIHTLLVALLAGVATAATIETRQSATYVSQHNASKKPVPIKLYTMPVALGWYHKAGPHAEQLVDIRAVAYSTRMKETWRMVDSVSREYQ
ncbi:hypothetical protein E2P81_ATG07245 [Venturia nashicola]|uniref:Uncharacterized protein n=1 Tax=Venturia nashicola TaxID=86259 RepID=A0A4Z1PDK4_9PEZI|nr:hypothetical protein E6O75_ATG07406 [Venturia nashicola]TLD31755.1 hypothetical protein E2P81_ATG07245 [Venturia nashicola]